jgi:hypothetical protein
MSSANNPLTPSFRKVHTIPADAAHPTVVSAIRDNDKSITDLNQAIAKLKSQITATTKSAASTTTEVTNQVTSQTVYINNLPPGFGTVNYQSSVTSYTTQASDNGALVLFSDPSPVAVTLSSFSVQPLIMWVQNWGGGVVTLTPSTGTISYLGNLNVANLPLSYGYEAFLVFDGTNWWAETLPIVPVATDSTLGIVQPDDSTIGITPAGIIYTMVRAGAGAPGFSGPAVGNLFYFDSTASPWAGYIWMGGAWNRFS